MAEPADKIERRPNRAALAIPLVLSGQLPRSCRARYGGGGGASRPATTKSTNCEVVEAPLRSVALTRTL